VPLSKGCRERANKETREPRWLQSDEPTWEESIEEAPADTNGRQSSPEVSNEVLVAHKVRLNNRASSFTYGVTLVPVPATAACEPHSKARLIRSSSKAVQWCDARGKACKVCWTRALCCTSHGSNHSLLCPYLCRFCTPMYIIHTRNFAGFVERRCCDAPICCFLFSCK
jgi:hypothetical protein